MSDAGFLRHLQSKRSLARKSELEPLELFIALNLTLNLNLNLIFFMNSNNNSLVYTSTLITNHNNTIKQTTNYFTYCPVCKKESYGINCRKKGCPW
ncbi:hypothetical protein V6O07_22650 [Arthrospira platensis SPKY2]